MIEQRVAAGVAVQQCLGPAALLGVGVGHVGERRLVGGVRAEQGLVEQFSLSHRPASGQGDR